MNKLFLSHGATPSASDSLEDTIYSETLSYLLEKNSEQSRQIIFKNDTALVEFIRENHISIVISDRFLSYQTALILRGLEIVIITLGESMASETVDLCIDPAKPEKIGSFSGPRYVLSSVLKKIPAQQLAILFGISEKEVQEEVDTNQAETELVEIINLFTKLKWDSDFFGMPVGYVTCMRLTPAIQKLVKNFIQAEGIHVLEYLCNCHDKLSVTTAEQAGYQFVDIRVTFDRTLSGIEPLPLPAGYRLGRGQPADIPHLKELATDIYRDSRYYFDGNFDREKVIEFYTSWIEKAVNGTFDDYVCVLYHGDNPVGFCSIKEHKLRSAKVGLVGMAPATAGSGLAVALMNQVLVYLKEAGKDRVEVVTQGRNYKAQRLYQKVGFLTQKTQIWYHKWFY